MYFLEGYLIGLGMIIFIGPVFFLLLSSTLHFGTFPGFLVALGIIISDIVCVLVCYYGLAPILTHPDSHKLIALAGGVLLIGIGIKYIVATKINQEEKIDFNSHDYISFFTKGFLVNFINPFVFMVWIGVIKYTEETIERNSNSTLLLCGALLGILTTDLLKVVLAKHIKKFIKPHNLKGIYKFFGFILIAFGIRMFFYFYY